MAVLRIPITVRQPPSLHFRDRPVRFGTAIAIELPGVPDLLDQPEIEVGNDEFVFVTTRNRYELPARVAEVTLSVELADVPRLLHADAIDRADEIPVRDGVGG